MTKPVGEPDAGNPHVRFDERGWETERRRMAQATAPILDSTKSMCRNVRLRAVVAIADVKRRSFYHPCFARRLGGVSGGRETQGWRDSSRPACPTAAPSSF